MPLPPIPYAPVRLYDPTQGGIRIADLIMRQGDIAARGAYNSGQIWGNAVQQLGNIAANAYQQHQEQKQADEAGRQQGIANAAVAGSLGPQGFDTEKFRQSLLTLPPQMQARALKAFSDANETWSKAQKAQQEAQAAQQKAAQDMQDHVGVMAFHTKQFMDDQPDGGLGALSMMHQFAQSHGIPGADQYTQQLQQAQQAMAQAQQSGDPNQVEWTARKIKEQFGPLVDQMQAGLSPDTAKKLIGARHVVGGAMVDDSGNVIYQAPEKAERPSVQALDTVTKQPVFITPSQASDPRYQPMRTGVNVNMGGGGMGSMAGSDPKAIADAIQAGMLPPDVSKYGRAVVGAVSSELAKSGFNLAHANLDWQATQKHVASLNGAGQLRLNQSINALPELLDSVEALANQWKGGRFPVLNRANLAAAKGGAYGSDVASVANKLDSQIADVVADLGTVYMGGNSPTDHGLELAGKSLKGEWGQKVLLDAVKLARQNVVIRRNSIQNTGVMGASSDNPYALQAPAAAPTAATPGGIDPEVQKRLDRWKKG